jgi:hypothetical protein
VFNKFSNYSRPLPEMLDGDNWEARNSNNLKMAYVDFKKKEFVVPFQAGAAGELVRAHEAMHVKISPRHPKYEGPDAVTYQAVEDTRVNQALRVTGIPTDKGRVFKEKEIKEALYNNPTPIRMGEALFATKGLSEEEDVRVLAQEIFGERKVLEICDEIFEKYFGENERNKELTSEEDAWKCVEELTKRLKEISTDQEKAKDAKGQAPRGKKNKNITESWQPGKTDAAEEQMLPVLSEEEIEDIKNALPHYKQFHYYGESSPGKAVIETPKMDASIKFKKVRGVKVTASDEGVIPGRMHRYATDMRVFSRKGKRRTGAAVLIDVSGSMSLTYDEILNIIRQCPASIVALYSAHGSKGIIRIVAEKGRLNTKLNKGMDHSNIVDLDALLWLKSRKEKKRLWISDGWVTGIGDQMLDDFSLRKVMRTIRDGRIERVGDVRELLASGKLIDEAFDDGHEIGRRSEARVVDSRGKTLDTSEMR